VNFYAEESFCTALEKSYFLKTRTISPTIFKFNDKFWQIPAVNGIKPISEFPLGSTFIDFHEPIDLDPLTVGNNYQQLSYLPKACQGMVTRAEWFDRELAGQYEPAPTILWENFSSWADFETYVRQHRSNLFSDSRRRLRKLAQNLGEVEFIFDDRRDGIMDTCMEWKSAQYRRSDYVDLFANSRHRQLFHELLDCGLLKISTLNAGGRLIAAHLGVLDRGRLYWWIPAYDPADSIYSPGRLLLELLIKESFERQHREFDFLIGNEDYKWYYATHVRPIGEMGVPPLAERVGRSIKSTVKPTINNLLGTVPGLSTSVRGVRSKLRQRLYAAKK
jgi:hypothetical protein